jgi:hypothetical protein
MNFDTFRPLFSRVVAGLIGSFAAYLETKYGIILDPDTKANLVVGALATFGVIYPIIHRLIDGVGKVNPGDAASKRIAVVEKAEAKELKQASVDATASTNYPE